MNKNYWNYTLDMIILITGTLCGITGIIKWPGLVYALGLGYQGLPMDAFTLIHDWTGLIMVVFVIIHVIRHLRWIAMMTKKIFHGVIKNEKT